MTTAIRTANYPNTNASFIDAGMKRIGQPTSAIAGGLELLQRPSKPLLRNQLLADSGSSETDIESRWLSVFPDADIVGTDAAGAKALRVKSEQRLREGNIINYWWALNKTRHDGFAPSDQKERHTAQLALLRDALLPAFFNVHPNGRALIVSYDPLVRAYIPGISVIRRAQLVAGDKTEMVSLMGKGSMSSLGSHGIPDLLHHALLLAFTIFWPKIHGFVASLAYEAFIIFILEDPITISENEPSRIFQIEPSLGGFMDNEPLSSGVFVSGKLPSRRHPFDRVVRYPVADLEHYAQTFIAFLDETIRWIMDLSRFPIKGSTAAPPDVDLDFALHAYLTLHILIVRSIAVLGGTTAMERKMGALDVVDLHCGLINASGAGAAKAFGNLVHRTNSATALRAALGRYGGNIGSHLEDGLDEIRDLNERIVRAGILYGVTASGITILGETALTSLNDFEVRLLRALRNTKHGFAIREASVLAMHTGAIDNDFPDLVGALALGLLADRSAYTLLR